MPNESLNMNTCWSNIKITSYFSFWKLDYFSDMVFLENIFDTKKILDGKLFMFFFLNAANHIEFFFAILTHFRSMLHLCRNQVFGFY